MFSIGSVRCLPKEVSYVSEKKSYIPDKAHEVLKNFKPAPYGEVAARLDELSRRTLEEAQKWESQEHRREKAGG